MEIHRLPANPTHDKVQLRQMYRCDLQKTLVWRNHSETRKWFKNSNVISKKEHWAWFSRREKDNADLVFIVERMSDGAPVGQVSIYGIDNIKSVAEVGRFITAPEYIGKGYMKVACKLLIKFAFEELKLRSLFLDVYYNNERAINLYISLGFKRTCRVSHDMDRFEFTINEFLQG